MFARKFVRCGAACALLSAIAWAQPSLTTISDVLFKADGTRFNGLAQFTWVSFESGNGSNIAQQSKTVRIIDGNLFVQLTPTTDAVPPAQYSVKYSSDGKIMFQEIWAVPSSTTTLRVRDVRTSQPIFPPGGGGGGGGGGIGGLTEILESDVTGLAQDLAARALKGPGFTNSRAAIINDTGGLEGAVGSVSDCVRVDGSAGPCPTFVDQEVPGGLVDGANTAFTIVSIPFPVSSLHLFRNGLLQKVGFDYTLSGSTITFVFSATPQPGDTLLASYRM
jgi:hypothetical protein